MNHEEKCTRLTDGSRELRKVKVEAVEKPEPNMPNMTTVLSIPGKREAVTKRNAPSAGGAGGVEPGDATARGRRALASFGLRRAPAVVGRARGGRVGAAGAAVCSSRRAPGVFPVRELSNRASGLGCVKFTVMSSVLGPPSASPPAAAASSPPGRGSPPAAMREPAVL